MKKLLIAILAGVMALSVAACGTASNPPADTGTPNTPSNSSTTPATTPETAPTGSGKVIVYSALGESDMVEFQEKFKTDTGIALEYMIFSAVEGSARVLA